jgi:hypothetical protein
MPKAVMVPDTEYSLAEAAILSQPWVATSTLPDVLARPAVITAAVEPRSAILRKVIIRKHGPELSVEIQASSGALPRSFIKSVEAVVELLSLPPGWNSYRAKPIASQNAIRAIRLLAELLEPETPAPSVVPRVQGGIQLEWHTQSIEIEIYIDSPDHCTFYAENVESGESTEGPVAGNEGVLKEWAQRISGK